MVRARLFTAYTHSLSLWTEMRKDIPLRRTTKKCTYRFVHVFGVLLLVDMVDSMRMCSECVCRKRPGAHLLRQKRDRARRGPGRRTFINSEIPGPEGTGPPQDAVACRTRNGQRRRCNKPGGVKSSSSVCPLVARQCASNAYRPAQRTLLACHTGSSKRTGIQRGR